MYRRISFAVVLGTLALLDTVGAVPLPDGGRSIFRRGNSVEHVVLYQEVLQVVAATSTVYVNSPPTMTSVSLTKAADIAPPPPPTPTPEAAKAAAPAPPGGTDATADVISGEATFYSPGMGSCGIESNDSQDVVALSHLIMSAQGVANPNANPLCGKKIRVKHTESGKTVLATVVDTCPGCAHDDIDLSSSCFGKIAALADGRVAVSWSLV